MVSLYSCLSHPEPFARAVKQDFVVILIAILVEFTSEHLTKRGVETDGAVHPFVNSG